MNPAVEFGLEIASVAFCLWFVVAVWPEHTCHHRDCPHRPNKTKGGTK